MPAIRLIKKCNPIRAHRRVEFAMPGRLIALGDIHGYLDALIALLAAIDPQPDDRIVGLGDYIDRGPDSRGVVAELIRLSGRCRLIPLLGNHDEMLLALRNGQGEILQNWLGFGGAETLASYQCAAPDQIPQEHIDFLQGCLSFYEPEEDVFFVHASYLPELPLDQQPSRILRWRSLRRVMPGPHVSGKTAVVGHTSQKDGRILDAGHLRCIDTYCYGGKWLTALDVQSGQIWQSDPSGHLRQRAQGNGATKAP